MNKKLLYVICLSTSTVFLLNYLMQPKKTGVPQDIVAGQSYTVPTHEALSKPVQREIDFVDRKRTLKERVTMVETELCSFAFSSYGAVLSHLDFKKHKGGYPTPLRTIHDKTFYEQEQGCFLLALDEKTPYFYELEGVDEQPQTIRVTYHTTSEGWHIRKIYTIAKHSYQFDVDLEFAPVSKTPTSVHPRLFVASPLLHQLQSESVNGVASAVNSSALEKVSSSDETVKAWVTPSLFGAEDKYFAHVMINDPMHFTQRAFYKRVGGHELFSIFEGPLVTQEKKYTISFYCGPKVLDAMISVDTRLEDLLSFGWFSWMCKLLLRLLELLYTYVGNYGLAILIITILVKIPFFPLGVRMRANMEKFQRAQPAIARIRQKYKNDMQMMQSEMMRYYREHNISPFALFSGLLPQLLQVPILISLYRVLLNYLDLYHAPFYGWIVNLSAKDPYYILPVVMGVSIYWQSSRSNAPDARQRVGNIFLALFLTALFANFPAGMVLYWTANSLLFVLEETLRKKFFPAV